MKRLLIFAAACFAMTQQASAWGQKGHDVTAYIAECHLTPRAAARIGKALDGHSLVYYANWMDNASNTPEYAYTKTWHYLNIDEGQTFETMPRNPNGDVLKAVTEIVDKLKKGDLSHEEENLCLRMLIHFVGDMHCPMHTGHLSDLGGNRLPVMFFRESTSLHTIWDTNVPEAAHKWSYTEWQREIDRASEAEVAEIQKGEPKEWLLETVAICGGLYAEYTEGMKVSYDYIAKYAPVVEQQFLRGGLRLARLLNEIYD